MSIDLDDAFKDYMRKVNPTVPQESIQYRESRRIFFAGGFSIFIWLTKIVTSMSDNEALKSLAELEAQFLEIRARVREERD